MAEDQQLIVGDTDGCHRRSGSVPHEPEQLLGRQEIVAVGVGRGKSVYRPGGMRASLVLREPFHLSVFARTDATPSLVSRTVRRVRGSEAPPPRGFSHSRVLHLLASAERDGSKPGRIARATRELAYQLPDMKRIVGPKLTAAGAPTKYRPGTELSSPWRSSG